MNKHLPGHWFPLDPPLPCPRSPRTRTIARWFGLQPRTEASPASAHRSTGGATADSSLLPEAGEIVLVTGASGSGKSSLLRKMAQSASPGSLIDLNHIRLPRRAVVDCIPSGSLHEVLVLLGRVGLAEAWTYLRTPDELSDGQRWRLRLAIGLDTLGRKSGAILFCDEFCALLDRVTAAVIAHALHRAIHRSEGGAVVATSHDDLIPALRPNRIITCDYGVARISHDPRSAARANVFPFRTGSAR